MEEPIFIVGMPRSGTTLVRMILNSHSKIAIAPETHFFLLFWSKRFRYGNLRRDDNFQRLWNDLTKCKYFRDLRLNNVQNIYNELFAGERSYKAIFEKLLKQYAKQNNKIRWGEKTPGHIKYLHTILSFYPYAKIIHVIRDPRDVALSLKKVPWNAGDVFINSKFWNQCINIPNKLGLSNSNLYIEVKYEDLVINPKDILEIICKFIGVEPEDQMLEFYRYSEQYMSINEPWKNGCLQPLSSRYVGKWKNELSDCEIEQIELTCTNAMIEKGYPQVKTNISSKAKIVSIGKNLQFYSILFMSLISKRIKDFLVRITWLSCEIVSKVKKRWLR